MLEKNFYIKYIVTTPFVLSKLNPFGQPSRSSTAGTDVCCQQRWFTFGDDESEKQFIPTELKPNFHYVSSTAQANSANLMPRKKGKKL